MDKLEKEINFLRQYNQKSVSISTTAKHAPPFVILPRRIIDSHALSSFMINDENLLISIVKYFDGLIDSFYIDVELKQNINLYKLAKSIVNKSEIYTMKPNDNTLESADILIRNQFEDDLLEKEIIVVGTGNLASKIALRFAERQAKVKIIGRDQVKVKRLIEVLNKILPKHSEPMQYLENKKIVKKADVIVSALSGLNRTENELLPFITEETFILDVGINNFSQNFIQTILKQNVKIVRLDTRFSLPYLFLLRHDYVNLFFENVFGKGKINNVNIVSGGYIGFEGSVIVDNLKYPSQIIGIADGCGGVKKDEQLSKEERDRIQIIKENISQNN